MSRDVTLLSSLTLSKAKDNGAQSLENSNGNFPAPQDFHNLDADFGAVELRPAVQQHDELRVGAAVRPGQALGRRHVAGAATRSSAAGSSPASTRVTPASR